LVIALLKIKTNQEKNKALKMSTTKPFSQSTVIALREFLKERGVKDDCSAKGHRIWLEN
jgi:hypothetical protein